MYTRTGPVRHSVNDNKHNCILIMVIYLGKTIICKSLTQQGYVIDIDGIRCELLHLKQ